MDRPLKFFRVVFCLCFVGLTDLALSPAPYLPPLDIFNWWDKSQHAIGYRYGDWQDALADGVGVIVALVFFNCV